MIQGFELLPYTGFLRLQGLASSTAKGEGQTVGNHDASQEVKQSLCSHPMHWNSAEEAQVPAQEAEMI